VDAALPIAPPVVAVVVANDPGPWFEDVLASLGTQDYPNLNVLVLVTDDFSDAPARVRSRLPDAYVRSVGGNPGFGPAANAALKLVEGNGFFCFLHDDIVLDSDVISLLIEELYRSNAGLVGPKLVDWGDPRVLQHVGQGADRFGEIDPFVEPGEVDQEQHDAVRDVFVLPTACLLVRADLFRELGGFHPGIDYHGDDLDLCWRAHLSGARVLVVPAAKARHVERLEERRPDLAHRTVAARHRVHTVLTLTSRLRVPLVFLQLLVVSILETVIGIFTGRAREGIASFFATIGAIPRLASIISRRRAVRPLRHVPNHEISELQTRGSARLIRFLRHRERENASLTPIDGSTRRRSNPKSSVLLFVTLVVLFVVGSRSLILDGVPHIGQFVDLPAGRRLLRAYLAGWNGAGFGAGGPPPTASALISGSVIVSVGRTGLVRLVLVLAPVLVGYLGAWRMVAFSPSSRSRVVGTVIYAAVPLPYAAIAAGRWSVLAVYAATPWVIELLRRVSGLATFASRSWGDDDIADAVVPVSTLTRVRIVAQLALITAVVGAFAPLYPLVVVGIAVVLFLATMLARGSISTLAGVAAAAVAALAALVANLPWVTTYFTSGGAERLTGPELAGADDLGILALAEFRIGPTVLGPLVLGLYVTVIAAALIGRGWRLTMAARAGALVLVFGAVAVLSDRGSLPFRIADIGVILVPVACGLALTGTCVVAGFEHDIRGARFGWRQPLALLVGVGLAAGVLPGLVGAANGRWSARSLGLAAYLQQLPGGGPDGDYRLLYVGDPRVLPVASRAYQPGVGYAVVDDGPPSFEDQFAVEPGRGDELTEEALTAMAAQTTTRVGRLLGPLGVRFIVVPIDDGVNAGHDSALPVPPGLLDSLSAQLDLRRIDSPERLVIYENMAWLPVRSILDATASAASREASAAVLAARPLGSGTPVLPNADGDRPASASVAAGTLHLAAPDDGQWTLTSGGNEVTSRRAFGWSVAWDLDAASDVRMEHLPGSGRRALVGFEVVVWALLLVASRAPGRRFSPYRRIPDDELGAPVLDLDLLGGVDLADEPATEHDGYETWPNHDDDDAWHVDDPADEDDEWDPGVEDQSSIGDSRSRRHRS
jgi:GT2 family glycosyltransferase